MMRRSIEDFENKLLGLLSNDNMGAYSFILSSASNTGKSAMAKRLVGKLLNTNELMTHGNLLWIDTEGKSVTVDEIRDISNFMYKTTYHPTLPKIIVIAYLDDLNTHSLNALLKILEEPTSNTYFILLVHNIESMPDTIRSRCIVTTLPPANLSDTHQIVKRSLPDIADSVLNGYLALSQNHGTVLALVNNNALVLYEEMPEFFKIGDKASTVLYEFIEKYFSTLEQLEIFQILIKHLIHKAIVNSSLPRSVRNDAGKLSQLDKEIDSLLLNSKTLGLDVKTVVLIVMYKVKTLVE
jgi:hypothetical protein